MSNKNTKAIQQEAGDETGLALPDSHDVFELADRVGELKKFGDVLVQSGFLPDSIKNASQAIVIMLEGRELGIPPMQAFQSIDAINGNPTTKPRTMVALALQTGELEDWRIERERDPMRVTCYVKRAGFSEITETWTLNRAKKYKTKQDGSVIPLTEKYNWRQDPLKMLEWRSIGGAFRQAFPDVLQGLYTPDEAQSMVPDDVEEVDEGDVEYEPSGNGVESQIEDLKNMGSETDEDAAEEDASDGDAEAPDEEESSTSAPDLFEEQAREIVDQNAGPAREEIGLADDPTLLYRALSIEQTSKQRKTVIKAIEERLSEIVSGEATCPTGKVPFEYEEDAEKALERAKEARDRGNEARQETRYYECGECGHYHLTSQEGAGGTPEEPTGEQEVEGETPEEPSEDPETVDMNTVLQAVGVYIDKSDVISIVDIRRTMEAHDMKDSALSRLSDTLHAVVEGDVGYQTEDGVIQLKDT